MWRPRAASPALVAESVGKRYMLSGGQPQYQTLRDMLARPWRRNQASPSVEPRELWALRDVSFAVQPGEVVGVIGRNGAGKSTLLKLVSRITDPTTGRLRLRGRVASLLEIGTGFHPELSGRENVFLNGAILGMTRAEIRRRFDEIVDFAELQQFIDVPVKRYSSGMYMRLAFSVAAHLEADLLLVDEVLAVGDHDFQQKCLGRLGQVNAAGRTVLFVSHNLHAVSTLTSRAIVLERGQLIFDGPTGQALQRYRASGGGDATLTYEAPETRSGVVQLRVQTSTGGPLHHFGQPLIVEASIRFDQRPKSGAFSFQLVDDAARPIVYAWLFESEMPWSRQGTITVRCEIPRPRAYMGRYSVTTYVSDRATGEHFETLQGLCQFEVVMDGIAREYEWVENTCTYIEDVAWSVS